MINDILDIAFKARDLDLVFNPLFVGPPGVGKSQIVQAYCKQRNIPFIDVRAAYYEAPDLIGFPSVEKVGERSRTVHHLPEFWPTEETAPVGILLFEEPNRGNTSVMNCMMQILTDRKVGNYTMPKKWIIVGCINPENELNDVAVMDSALKDRFEIFSVEFDFESFVDYMKDAKWHQSIINFVETKTWNFVLPEEVSKNDGAKYNSPRTLSKLNAALQATIPKSKDDKLERTIYDAVLGKLHGNNFYYFKYNAQPVLYKDITNPKTRQEAFTKLRTFSDPNNYKSGTVAVTIKDIATNMENPLTDQQAKNLLAEILLILPADQGPKLVSDLSYKHGDKENNLLKTMGEEYPEIQKYFKKVLKQ